MEFLWLASIKQAQGCLWVWVGWVFFCIQYVSHHIEPFLFSIFEEKNEIFATGNFDPFLSI